MQAYLAPDVFAPAGPATVALVQGKAWIVQNAIIDTWDDNQRGSGDTFRTFVWQSASTLGRSDWPTFKHDAARTGRVVTGTETWAPYRTPTLFVAQLYRDFLNREADPGGLAYWSALLQRGGSSGANLAEAFMTSPEFHTKAGPVVRLPFGLGRLPPTDFATMQRRIEAVRTGTPLVSIANELVSVAPFATMSNADYAWMLFSNVYDRPPSASEHASLMQRLQSGTSKAQLLVDEQKTLAAVMFATNEVWVTMSYMGMMRRMPETGGFNYWVARLDEGVSLNRLAGLFQFSDEYTLRHSS
jgi:hypothetical protein